MRKLRQILFLVFCLAPTVSYASVEEVIKLHINEGQIVGQGRLSVLFWDIYDVSLYAPNGQWDEQKPFALSFHYLRSISGEEIASSSADEIRKQGVSNTIKLTEWHEKMRQFFPDVKNGTVLTGVFIPDSGTHFYMGKRPIGKVNDPEFGRYFYNIWLGKNTSEPGLRKKLMGL